MKLKRDYLTIFYFIFSIQIFAQNGEFLDTQNSSESTTNPTFSAVKEQLFEHTQKIQDLRTNLIQLEKKLLSNFSHSNFSEPDNNINTTIAEPLAYPISSTFVQDDKIESSELVITPIVDGHKKMGVTELIPQKTRIGFYILPFIALQGSDGLDYLHSALKANMEHDLGFASGWRVGAETNRLFLEAEFSYNRNELKGRAELANGIPGFSNLSSEGESESFGFMINAGAKYDLSEKIHFLLGAGFGGMNQEIGFTLAGFPVPESEQTIFAAQILGGLNYQLAQNFRIGARYRWMRVSKMDLFAYRSLHLAELSLGYFF